jgi:hypothetical protein
MSWKENPLIQQLTPIGAGWNYTYVWHDSDDNSFNTEVLTIVALSVVAQEYSDGVENTIEAVVLDPTENTFVRTSDIAHISNVAEVGIFPPGASASQEKIDDAIEKLKRKLHRKAA